MIKTKDIEGFEGVYKITETSQVWSVPRVINGRKFGGYYLKQRVNNRGYTVVTLKSNGKSKPFSVHRLVALAFLPNPLNKPFINQIDGDKTNTNIKNLEWCTASENMLHSYHILGNNSANGNKCFKVLQFTKEGEFVKEWDSIIGIERELGFRANHITENCKGKNKSSRGFVWKYAER